MEGFNRWVAAHKRLAEVLFDIFLCGTYTILLAWLGAAWWFIVLFDLFMLLLTHVWVQSCQEKLMIAAVNHLHDHCDPMPLMKEIELQFTYQNSEIVRQTLLINQGVALRCAGEYQQVYDLLKSINIDKCAGMPPYHKVVYYNNLMDICAQLGHLEEARVWYAKMMQLYDDVKGKMKKQLEPTVLSAKAGDRYCAQDYIATLQILDSAVPPKMSAAVEDALLYAQACIALGDTETAKRKLNWVILHGNKLYAVQEARELMAILS